MKVNKCKKRQNSIFHERVKSCHTLRPLLSLVIVFFKLIPCRIDPSKAPLPLVEGGRADTVGGPPGVGGGGGGGAPGGGGGAPGGGAGGGELTGGGGGAATGGGAGGGPPGWVVKEAWLDSTDIEVFLLLDCFLKMQKFESTNYKLRNQFTNFCLFF